MATEVVGTLCCRRCGAAGEAHAQTRAFAGSAGDPYMRVAAGAEVEVDDDGLADLNYQLRAWSGPGPVRVVLGEATCRRCGMPNQRLVARLDRVGPGPWGFRAALGAVTTFDAADPGAYAHVEYLDEDLCRFANHRGGGAYTDSPPAFSVPPDRVPAEVAAGYARWLDDYTHGRFGPPG